MMIHGFVRAMPAVVFAVCSVCSRGADAGPVNPPHAKFTYTDSLRRIKTIRDANDTRIDAEKLRLLTKLKNETTVRLVAIRDRFTREDKLDEAFAVKALSDDPDSAAAREKAPAETKPVLADYDVQKASIMSAAAAASKKLADDFYEALKGEMKAAMTRGDFDTASGLKAIVETRGSLPDPGAPAAAKADAKSPLPGPADFIGISFGCAFPRGLYFWEFKSATELVEWKQGRPVRTPLTVEPDGKGGYIVTKPGIKWHLKVVDRDTLVRSDWDGGSKYVYKRMKDDAPVSGGETTPSKKDDPDDTPFGKRVKTD